MNPHHLQKLIEVEGIPVHGVSPRRAGGWHVDYKDGATQTQRDQGDAIAKAFNPSQQDEDDWEQQQRRQAAKTLLTDPGPEGILRRAMARAFGQQFNPPKTLEQLRSVIDPDIDAGNCD